uniref:Secreted protein n=1 Tax=Panagrellus redivivus TaxID=6233 RepID=A0A7E4UR42_PANRE
MKVCGFRSCIKRRSSSLKKAKKPTTPLAAYPNSTLRSSTKSETSSKPYLAVIFGGLTVSTAIGSGSPMPPAIMALASVSARNGPFESARTVDL